MSPNDIKRFSKTLYEASKDFTKYLTLPGYDELDHEAKSRLYDAALAYHEHLSNILLEHDERKPTDQRH